MLVIAVGSVWITRNDGFRDRQIATLSPLPREQQQLEAKLLKVFNLRYDYGFAKLYGDKPCFRFKESQTMDLFIQNGCLDKQFPGRPTVFLLGDSHSASLSIGLIPMLSAHEINFPHVSYGWCTPTGDFNDNPICRDMNEKTLAKIEEYKPAVLIIDASWVAAAGPSFTRPGTDYVPILLDYISLLKSKGPKHILIVGQIPTYNHSLPERLISDYVRSGLPIPERTKSAQQSSIDMDAMMRALPYPKGVTYLSMFDILCNGAGCLTKVGPDLERDVLLWDYGHLTANGSEFVTKAALEPLLMKLIQDTAYQQKSSLR
jgi:hypothetical protein